MFSFVVKGRTRTATDIEDCFAEGATNADKGVDAGVSVILVVELVLAVATFAVDTAREDDVAALTVLSAIPFRKKDSDWVKLIKSPRCIWLIK